jgi:competence protein ComEA
MNAPGMAAKESDGAAAHAVGEKMLAFSKREGAAVVAVVGAIVVVSAGWWAATALRPHSAAPSSVIGTPGPQASGADPLRPMSADGTLARIANADGTVGSTTPPGDPTGATSTGPEGRIRDPSSAGKGRTGRRTRGSSSKLRLPGDGTVNINTASLEELQRLPGVGPAMAQRISDYRAQVGPFRAVEQLQDVRGIGPAKYGKMLPFVVVR